MINKLVDMAHENAVNKGWWDDERTFLELASLIHSEISEAVEDFRNGKDITEIYFEGKKPCGIPIELADTIIRIFDLCGRYGIDLETAIMQKMDYNLTRPYKHGKKV